jgi:hypothetical protein
VNRQQFALVVTLGLLTFAAGNAAQAADWKSSSDDNGGSTLSGKLYRNSADQNGAAPYLLLDKWGVVRGYIAAAPGVDLEASVGQQVNLHGTVRSLPGGDMPVMTCDKIAGSGAEQVAPTAAAGEEHRRDVTNTLSAAATGWEAKTVRSQEENATAPSARPMPIREVVLEPQPAAANNNNEAQPDPAPAHHAAPRRVRNGGARMTAYQESVPAPNPATGHMVRSTPEPMADPSMEHVPSISQGSMMQGPMMEGQMVEGPMNGDASCGGDCGSTCEPCNSCCDEFDACWGPRAPLFCWGPTGIWAKIDYLLWTQNGTHVPALVTQGSINDAHPGALGQPGTTVLYGDGLVNDDSRSGFRFEAGLWLNRCATFGFEGEFLNIGDEESTYHLWSDGSTIVARPFNDASLTPFQPRAELVAFPRGNPNSLDGTIDVSAVTHFNGAAARFLVTLCRQDGCWTDECGCSTYHDRFRMIFTGGYRYLDLDDSLSVSERLTTTAGTIPGTNLTGTEAFAIDDAFRAHNTFNGGELGMKFEFQRNRWGLEAFPRIGLGSTHQEVTINGTTVATDVTGARTTSQGGLLAQPTNIGTHAQDMFSVVPEIDIDLSWQATAHTKLVIGYSFLYWNNVARVGEQINTNVNSTTLPGSPVPPAGDTTQPRFTFAETGFWAQGLNAGVDIRW